MTQRRPRLHDDGFLRFLRGLKCCIGGCGMKAEAAHIRMSLLAIDKPITGGARKPDDRYAAPLCAWHHRLAPDSQHNVGDEEEFWRRKGIDPFELSARLYDEYGGDGGKPRERRTTIKSRLPKEQRQKIPSRKQPWPKRTFARNTSR